MVKNYDHGMLRMFMFLRIGDCKMLVTCFFYSVWNCSEEPETEK